MPRVAFLVPYPGKLFRNNKNQENNLKLGLKVTSKALTPPCGVLLAFLMNDHSRGVASTTNDEN
jgi:hypothetical protein